MIHPRPVPVRPRRLVLPRDPGTAYRLRWKRRRLLWRGLRARHRLRALRDRTGRIRPGDVLVFCAIRNEIARLPHFLDHYRRLGAAHFLVVDNASDDGSAAWLAAQDDVSLWATPDSYRAARFGLDWLGWLLMRHGHGHWCLTLDADEILVYPHCDTRTLPALCDHLGRSGRESFGALMIDLYPRGPLAGSAYRPGADPAEVLGWFDAGNYSVRRQAPMENLWIQGGPRARCFFADAPRRAPTLNKVPLVKWHRRYVYVNSTHSALPPRLNQTYAEDGGESLTGALLHTKFLDQIVARAAEELRRGEHFADPDLYAHYYRTLTGNPTLWCETSTRYRGWRHLAACGLMSRGGWL